LTLNLEAAIFPPVEEAPRQHWSAIHPARYYVYEWSDYYLKHEAADKVQIGTEQLVPVHSSSGLFHIRWKNRLGLTKIQPFAKGRALGSPVYVEVISSKFSGLEEHLAFLQPLLTDLFTRAARIPFDFTGETARGVTESLQPPTPLFTLHFLRQYGPTLSQALATILGEPHHRLHEKAEFVPLVEATEVDADVLTSIFQNPDTWQPARGFLLAEQLQGYAPHRVWQRQAQETFDTPENRFVLAFLRQLLAATEALLQSWWTSLREDPRQALVRSLAAEINQALGHTVFGNVGQMHYLPLSSQVMLRREGYRDMLHLWRIFHQARRPLFAFFQEAIELRDVARLYEMWVFFALVEEIASWTGQAPLVDLHLSDVSGLGRNATARFVGLGVLHYNQEHSGYSGRLRPDFTWTPENNAVGKVVLDAKFRLERFEFESEDIENNTSVAKSADLYKMHTYRDALEVRAAVCLFPGDSGSARFYDYRRRGAETVTLQDVLAGNFSGIGAVPMKPGSH
jgi:uncharacterized protein